MSNKDTRIVDISSLATPNEIANLYPVSPELSSQIEESRRTVENILSGKYDNVDEDKFLYIGKCHE